MTKLLSNKKGQALVTLLFVSVIGITIATTAAILLFRNIQATSIVENGTNAYYVAESGIEEAILRTLRNPTYSGTPLGQPLQIGDGSVVISTSSGGIITSVGTYNGSTRRIQVRWVYNNGMLTVLSWKEIK